MTRLSASGFRPPRVRIPYQEPVSVRFGGKQFKAPLSTISVTGGVLHMPAKYMQGTFADIIIPTAFGPVYSPIEFLTTTVAGQRDAVAFRFFNMDADGRKRLEQTIQKMLRQGFGERHDGWFQKLARRILSRGNVHTHSHSSLR